MRPVQWAVAVSLVCVSILLTVGWSVSYRRPIVVLTFRPGGRPVAVTVGRGIFYGVWGTRVVQRVDASLPVYCLRLPIDEIEGDRDALMQAAQHTGARFQFAFAVDGGGSNLFDMPFAAAGVPLWFLFPILAVVTWRSVAVIGRRYRRCRLGLCPVCGYDVRGITTRCPECGALVVDRTPGVFAGG